MKRRDIDRKRFDRLAVDPQASGRLQDRNLAVGKKERHVMFCNRVVGEDERILLTAAERVAARHERQLCTLVPATENSQAVGGHRASSLPSGSSARKRSSAATASSLSSKGEQAQKFATSLPFGVADA